MKKTFSVLLLLTIILNVEAQITIGPSDMPQVGDQYIRSTDYSPGVTPGNAGGNQIWNFSNLNNDQIDSMQFVNPSSAPLFSDFNSATIAYKASNGNGLYIFCKTTVDSFNILGFVTIPQLTECFYSPPIEQLPIPCTYQTSWGGFTNISSKASTTLYPGYDSIMHLTHQVYSDTIDAWGSVITPLGTYNAIRDYQITNNTDSIWLHSTSSQTWSYYQTQITGSRVYIWRTNGIHERIVRMYVDNLGNPTSVTWIQSFLQGITQEQESSLQQIFPNPAKDEIFIKTNSLKINFVKIFDLYGNEIETIQVVCDLVPVNTAEYPSGIYFYELIGEPEEIIHDGKFIILR